ncbi:MAG: phosphatase PAP2 family protein [Pseudomonadota bacterium]
MGFSVFLPTDVTILDKLARTVLMFDSALMMGLLMVTGFILLPRANRHFAHLLLLTFSTMLVNTILKHWFAVPLAPNLGVGFAFPSGHMQFAAAFYVWLMFLDIPRWSKAIMVLILCLIAPSMVHFGYHNWTEIGAGALVGGAGAYLYWVVLSRLRTRGASDTSMCVIISVLDIALMFGMFYQMGWAHIPGHVWMAFYLVLGFSLTWRQNVETHGRRWFGLGLAMGVVVIAAALAKELRYAQAVHIAFSQLPYLLVGVMLPMVQTWQAQQSAQRRLL